MGVIFYLVTLYSVIVLLNKHQVYTLSSNCVCLQHVTKSLKNPVYIQQTTDGTGRFLVAEQSGIIRQYTSTWKDGSILLDISSLVVHDGTPIDERGLLGFALHPNFKKNKKIYLYSIRSSDGADYVYITEVIEQRGTIDKDKETTLLTIKQPHDKRNGGQLLFGKDGYLYIFVGDGGVPDGVGDAAATQAQNGSLYLGKVLRINVDKNDTTHHYKVPDDNPLVGNKTWLPEIYAYGCRNMWRCSVDFGSVNGDIYCGETGSTFQEEIDIIQAGGNYGWNIKEGNTCMKAGFCDNIENEIKPVYVYNRTQSYSAIIGGYVYRGKKISRLIGHYIFGDVAFSGFDHIVKQSGKWVKGSMDVCPSDICPCNARASPGTILISFSQDNEGELYAIMMSPGTPEPNGAILKMVPPRQTTVTCTASLFVPSGFAIFVTICILILNL